MWRESPYRYAAGGAVCSSPAKVGEAKRNRKFAQWQRRQGQVEASSAVQALLGGMVAVRR